MFEALWTFLRKKWRKRNRKKNITISVYSASEENENVCPPVDRIIVGEDVDIIYQFVKESSKRDVEYIKKNSSSNRRLKDISNNLIGKPTERLYGGYLSRVFVMNYGGFEISRSTWQKQTRISRTCNNIPQDNSNIFYNYIDLEFDEAVYPIRVSIHEIFNPGYVIQIWAQDSQDNRWIVLWTGQRQLIRSCAERLFSPPLQFCNFKTKNIRLNFLYSFHDYHTWLESVVLIGTSKLILPKNSEQSLTHMLKSIPSCQAIDYNLTPDYSFAHWDLMRLRKNFSKYCTIYKSDLHLNHAEITKDIKFSLEESEKHTRCSFSRLPDEVIIKILKNLDIRSLCRMSTMDKHLNNLTRDPSLFKCLNLLNIRDMHSMYIDDILSYFTSRCKYLQQLDLTLSDISLSHFEKFLYICNGRLTHLRLSKCNFVNELVLFRIATCNNLKVLDLSYCKYDGDGFSYLENLECLEELNLNYTRITAESICKILRKNRRIRDLNLNYSSNDYYPIDSEFLVYFYIDERYRLCLDAIAITLKNSCPDLEILDISGGLITSQGIDALAECKNLRKLNIQEMNNGRIDKSSLRRLFSSCQRLEEINLMYLDDDFGESLTLCKNLKQVYLRTLSRNMFAIFVQCPKLQKICFMKGDGELVHWMKQKLPHVFLCKLQPKI